MRSYAIALACIGVTGCGDPGDGLIDGDDPRGTNPSSLSLPAPELPPPSRPQPPAPTPATPITIDVWPTSAECTSINRLRFGYQAFGPAARVNLWAEMRDGSLRSLYSGTAANAGDIGDPGTSAEAGRTVGYRFVASGGGAITTRRVAIRPMPRVVLDVEGATLAWDGRAQVFRVAGRIIHENAGYRFPAHLSVSWPRHSGGWRTEQLDAMNVHVSSNNFTFDVSYDAEQFVINRRTADVPSFQLEMDGERVPFPNGCQSVTPRARVDLPTPTNLPTPRPAQPEPPPTPSGPVGETVRITCSCANRLVSGFVPVRLEACVDTAAGNTGYAARCTQAAAALTASSGAQTNCYLADSPRPTILAENSCQPWLDSWSFAP